MHWASERLKLIVRNLLSWGALDNYCLWRQWLLWLKKAFRLLPKLFETMPRTEEIVLTLMIE